jgi:hypothetical protein
MKTNGLELASLAGDLSTPGTLFTLGSERGNLRVVKALLKNNQLPFEWNPAFHVL